jgi:arylsulfatase A-like enzyme
MGLATAAKIAAMSRFPGFAWRRGVKQGVLEQARVSTMDTAATVLWLLGLSEQTDSVGEAVIQAYDAGAEQVAARVE